MRRTIETSLTSWKQSINRKPLVFRGARQVGKTYALKEFGRLNYSDVAYFNFEKQRELAEIFQVNLDVKRIIQVLSAVHGRLIQPEKTLMIFDEIQACGAALTSLKYFFEIRKSGKFTILEKFLYKFNKFFCKYPRISLGSNFFFFFSYFSKNSKRINFFFVSLLIYFSVYFNRTLYFDFFFIKQN